MHMDFNGAIRALMISFAGLAVISNVKADDLGNGVRITPLSEYSADSNESQNSPQGIFSGNYTRLLVLRVQDSGKKPEMKYQKRKWLSRALMERNYSVNLTIRVEAGRFEAVVPLATVSQQSGTKGEKWDRVIHHERHNFPLFLVANSGYSSTPSVRVSVKGDENYSSNIASTAVQVAISAAQISGQPSPLVTNLSSGGVRAQAQAIDQAISQLFSSSLSEEHWSDRDLRQWRADGVAPSGILVSFKVPDAKNFDWNSAYAVGQWRITFDYPRPSAFVDWRICPGMDMKLARCAGSVEEARKKVLHEVDSGDVLNYQIASGSQGMGTIRSYLAQKDWFTTYVLRMARRENEGSEASTAFCRAVLNEMQGIGLSGFDSRIVLWAISDGLPYLNQKSLLVSGECKKIIESVKSSSKS